MIEKCFSVNLIIETIKLNRTSRTHGPLENVWEGGGGGGRSTKKYSRKGKLNEKKVHARQLMLKNIHAMA